MKNRYVYLQFRNIEMYFYCHKEVWVRCTHTTVEADER